MSFEGSNVSLILLRQNRRCLDVVNYQVGRDFSYYPQINATCFLLGAVFIRGGCLLVILLPSAAFNQGRRLLE